MDSAAKRFVKGMAAPSPGESRRELMRTASDRIVMRVRGLSSALVLDYPVHPRVRYGWGHPRTRVWRR